MKKANKSNDIQEIKALLEQLPEDKQPIANNLYEKLSFMHDTLTELQKAVETGGAVELFRQGSNEYLRESPALKAYNTTIQRYVLVVGHIMNLFPKQAAAKADAELQEFIKQGQHELRS